MNPADIRVLIVDDEEDIREIIRDNFETIGFQVSTCDSGNKAIQLFDKGDFNIVVSDIRMNDGDGVDLLKHIKSNNPNFPPVFLISGYSDYELSDLYAYGADGFFSKPFNLDDLRRNVKYALLSREDFWSNKPKWTSSVTIRRNIEDPGSLLSPGPVQAGRGGFFIEIEKNVPQQGHPVEFEFIVKNTKTSLQRIYGVGEIVWSRETTDEPRPARNGCGVEVKYMDEKCRKDFIRWIEGCLVTPYIPRGRF